MTRHYMTVDGPVPFTPEEEASADAREAQIAAEKPMKDWVIMMQESDANDMSREMEDHITDHHEGIAGNQYSQIKYDAKKMKRSQKPI